MGQMLLHQKFVNGQPDSNDLPIITKFSSAYKLWHSYLVHLPRLTRFTLGTKIDGYFIDCLELSLSAGYAPRETKSAYLRKLSTKLDCLKFFLKILWELKSLDNKKYITLSSQLAEIGKMIGGWLKLFKQ